jgi:transketolase
MSALTNSLNLKAANLCKATIKMCTKAGSGHPSSGLSLSHIVTTLMYNKMRFDPANPWNTSSDRLVLSEGHAVPIVYAAYADLGGVAGKTKENSRALTMADLDTLRELNSWLDGHPNPAEGMPFFDAATGSLGQGLSVSAGLALAAKADGSDRIIYCIMGDGESREGQVWEAVDFIAEKGLTNVVAIFNCNKQAQSEYVAEQQSPKSLAAKCKAAGWNAVIIDGHKPEAILAALKLGLGKKKPLAICAKTVKGWGSSLLTSGNWHGKPLPAADVEKALADFDKIIKKLEKAGAKADPKMLPAKPAKTTAKKPLQQVSLGDPMEILKADKAYAEKGKIATRRAYGLALVALGKANKDIVALDADVKNSTFAIYFHDKYPDRFYECRIAEQNMVSVAVGLSAGGKVPFASTFAKFFARAYDQVEMAEIGRANVKLVGSHCGSTLGADGPSQMSLADVAYFGSMSTADNGQGSPIAITLQPADGVATIKLTEMMANHQGVCYMRTLRSDTKTIYNSNDKFAIGATYTIVKGKDIAIFAAAYMVHEALAAAKMLKEQGIEAAVVDAYCLPINAQEVINAAAASSGRILTVEDNYGHGMGAAVAQIAAAQGNIKVQSMTISKLPKSGKQETEILKYLGVDADSIVAKAKSMVR